MKRIIFLLILFLSISFYTISQEIYGIAEYRIKLANDWFFFDGTLKFNSQKSFFVSKQRNLSRWKITNDDINSGTTEYNVEVVYTDTIGHIVFRELDKPYLTVRDFCKENQVGVYNDTINFNWKIKQKTKNLQGLECRLATCHFRGRDYKAWFTLSIPLPYGPWKFGGLPGLIVEIQDNKSDVIIQLKSIDLNTKSNIEPKLSGNKTTFKEMYSCKDKEWEKEVKKTIALFAKLRAENPDLEIETETPERRPATELVDFNQ
ncbi:MAG: GLPGLI family protein [Bacteroidales bacterium]|nr:GLPGLI family protein [Bacteroidales bacterium]